MKNNNMNAFKTNNRGKLKGRIKGIVAIALSVVLVGGTIAGCSCQTNNTTTTASTGYKCDFTNKDIAIPEGTKFTDNGLEVTDKADATVKNVLDIEKQLPVLIARDGEEPSPELKYMQETNAKKLRWNNYNAVADYTAETANQIDPTFGKVTEFGKDVFNLARAYYTGDVGAAISGVSGVLNMFGIFGSSGGASNEQILMAVQQVYSLVQDVALDVKDLQGLTTAMSMQLDETTMQAYRNGLQPFDNAVIALDTDAEILQEMLVTGATILQGQGINAPAENATDAERQEYIGKLIATIEEQQNTNPDLKNFDSIMNDLINNYTLVTGELSKTNDFSPLTAYDKYWDTYFNWESQGYALREAYRGNAEFEVKRAYALIALYYNIGTGNTAVTYKKYGQLLNDALTQIEQNGSGISPQVVADNWHRIEPNYSFVEGYTLSLENGLYSGTFDKRLFEIYDASPQYTGDETKNGVNVSTGIVEKYVSKFHGKTLREDMALAGMSDIDSYVLRGEGLMFNIAKKDKGKWKCDLVTWDGNLIKDKTIKDGEPNQDVYELK
ncbi:MAG: hypothetical protein E7279_09565 [Lachnospiraceae bacterium]|nr:hypothetical protein [Lachnospiraceae bacterium]